MSKLSELHDGEKEEREGEALEEWKDTFFPSPFSRSPLESGVQDPSHNPTGHYKFQSTAPDLWWLLLRSHTLRW